MANAPRPAERQSERPVEASRHGEKAEPENRQRREHQRGQYVDITV